MSEDYNQNNTNLNEGGATQYPNHVTAEKLVENYHASLSSDLDVFGNTIVNLSSFQLESHDISLLKRGLTFCPTPGEPDMGELRNDLDRFHRSVRLTPFLDNLKKNPIPQGGNNTHQANKLVTKVNFVFFFTVDTII